MPIPTITDCAFVTILLAYTYCDTGYHTGEE